MHLKRTLSTHRTSRYVPAGTSCAKSAGMLPTRAHSSAGFVPQGKRRGVSAFFPAGKRANFPVSGLSLGDSRGGYLHITFLSFPAGHYRNVMCNYRNVMCSPLGAYRNVMCNYKNVMCNLPAGSPGGITSVLCAGLVQLPISCSSPRGPPGYWQLMCKSAQRRGCGPVAHALLIGTPRGILTALLLNNCYAN